MRTCTIYYAMCSWGHGYWETDTMYLSGIKSIVRVYRRRGSDKIEFYAEQGARYVHHSFYEDR